MALGGPIYLESDGCLSHFDTTECYFSQLRDFIITECWKQGIVRLKWNIKNLQQMKMIMVSIEFPLKLPVL